MTRDLSISPSKAIVGLAGIASLVLDVGVLDLDDAIWRALLVVAIAALARDADRRALIVASAGALVLSGADPVALSAAVVSLAATAWVAQQTARPDAPTRHAVAAIAGGSAAISLCHQGHDLAPLVAAGAALVALAPVTVNGVQRLPRTTRRWVLRGAGAVVLLAFLSTALAVGVTMQARGSLSQASNATQAGLDAARKGEVEMATARFQRAADGFESAHADLTSPLTAPARALPLVGDSIDATVTASTVGGDLARSAVDLAGTADYRSLRLVDGRLDLEAVTAMVPHVAAARAEVLDAAATTAEIDRSWLPPPVADEVRDLDARLEQTAADLATAEQALGIAPLLLGGDEPTHWYVMFTQPAESRNGGGFVADYALLRAEDGRVEKLTSGPIAELTRDPSERTVDPPPWYGRRYNRYDLEHFFENHTAAADHPSNAGIAAQLVPQTGRPEIDGVITIDPTGLAALLELTGPVRVPELDEPMTTDNVEEFLLIGQYERDEERQTRKDMLHEVGSAAFDKLLAGNSPGPARIARVLGPAVAGGHLSVVSLDDVAQPVLTELGVTGAFLPPVGRDWISVRHANADASKVDIYLKRQLEVRTQRSSAGEIASTAMFSITNEAPAGLPPYVADGRAGLEPATARMLVTFMSPHRLVEARVNGSPASTERDEEPPGMAYTVLVDVPRGTTSVIEMDLVGRVVPGPDELTVIPQAAPTPMTATVEIDGDVLAPGPKHPVEEPTVFTG